MSLFHSTRTRVAMLLAWVSVAFVQPVLPQNPPGWPRLRTHGTATQLVVHGEPFLMLGGELGNSSASSLAFMAPVWPRLKAMGLNTVLMPVSWELIEPSEGVYDFSLVDGLIRSSRTHGLKIVVLWFGSWKNSMSCYVPSWVKTNQQRFPRARTGDGKAVEILSPFSEESRNADARAFAAFMKHLRSYDGKENTVVMIQVENEIGMIPEARDRCPEAEKAFAQQVPQELMAYLHKFTATLTDEIRQAWSGAGSRSSGTWEEVFGKGLASDEIFMSWHFARYTDAVAEAGKSAYPLPMYVNAALIRPNYKPGQYPSAGPLPHLMDIWRAGAPHMDFLAPDIYFRNFAEWLGKYDRSGNAVFVPEVDRRQSVANAFYAFSRHNAMGYSPFSIESADNPADNQFTRGYRVLQQLAPLILEHQGTGTMAGFLLDSAAQAAEITLGGYVFTVRHAYAWPYAARADGDIPRYGGMIVMTGSDEFTIAGSGVVITCESARGDGTIAGIERLEEGAMVRGKWVALRRLNGDEDHQGRHVFLPGGEYGIQKLRLYRYK